MSVVIDAGEGADRADDGVGGGSGHVLGAFKNKAEHAANAAVASGDEIEGVGMTVDGAEVDFIVVGDGARAHPIQEFFLDSFAVRMLANRTLRFVAVEVDAFRAGG